MYLSEGGDRVIWYWFRYAIWHKQKLWLLEIKAVLLLIAYYNNYCDKPKWCSLETTQSFIYFPLLSLVFLFFCLAKLQLSTSLVSRLQLVLLQNLRVLLLLLLLLLTLSLCLQGTLSSSLVLLVYLFTVCVFRAGKRGFYLLSLWLLWHIVCLTCDSSCSRCSPVLVCSCFIVW